MYSCTLNQLSHTFSNPLTVFTGPTYQSISTPSRIDLTRRYLHALEGITSTPHSRESYYHPPRRNLRKRPRRLKIRYPSSSNRRSSCVTKQRIAQATNRSQDQPSTSDSLHHSLRVNPFHIGRTQKGRPAAQRTTIVSQGTSLAQDLSPWIHLKPNSDESVDLGAIATIERHRTALNSYQTQTTLVIPEHKLYRASFGHEYFLSEVSIARNTPQNEPTPTEQSGHQRTCTCIGCAGP